MGRGKLEHMWENFEEYVIIKIIDIITTVIITLIVVKLLEPYLKSSSLAAQVAIQAMLRRL